MNLFIQSRYTLCWIIFYVIIISILSCKKNIQFNYSGFIIGNTYDIRPITKEDIISEDIIHKAFYASVLIETKLKNKQRKLCSGVLGIIDNISMYSTPVIITNYHCFLSIPSTQKDPILDNIIEEACYNTHVYFGIYKNNTDNITQLTCDPKTFIYSKEGDIALFQTKEPIPDQFKPIKITQSQNLLDYTNKPIIIVHYSLANTQSMIATKNFGYLPYASLTFHNCQTLQLFPKRFWYAYLPIQHSVEHTCDIIEGSSGAGLINVNSKELIGINWGGIEIQVSNNLQNINGATRSDFILALLNNQIDAIKIKESEYYDNQSQNNQKTKNKLTKCAICCITTNINNPYHLVMSIILFIIPIMYLLIFRKSKT